MHWTRWILVAAVASTFAAACAATGLLLYYGSFLVRDRRVIRGNPQKGENFVPKITYQTWKNADLNASQKRSRALVAKHYPDHEHLLFTDADIDAFAAAEFPEFYADTWQRMTPFIKKVDCWRYMVLYKRGGIYFDIDVMVKRNMTRLFDVPEAAYVPAQNEWLLWRDGADAASPAIIASAPGNPLWLKMLDYIRIHHTAQYLKDHPREEVLVATGPCALAYVLKNSYQTDTYPLVLLSEARLGLGSAKKQFAHYSYHDNETTWRA